MLDPSLTELAESYGVSISYEDNNGVHREVSAETVTAVLAAFGVNAGTPEAIEDALIARNRESAAEGLAPSTIVREGSTAYVAAPADCTTLGLLLEDGTELTLGPDADDADAFRLPDTLPTGYHTLTAHTAAGEVSAALIVVPRFLGMPAATEGRRVWGYGVQLYSVHSRHSWAFGDLVDLAELAEWSAAAGAGYLLTNPLHAAEPTVPISDSPYSPSNRRFLNPVYVRPEAIARYTEGPPSLRARVDRIRQRLLVQLAGSDLIDRDAVWTAKIAALQAIYDSTPPDQRRLVVPAATPSEDAALREFATWCAVAELHGQDPAGWPGELRDVSSPQVARFAAEQSARVDFYRWLQVITAEQLATAQRRARGAGMPIGIVTDLAVGVGTLSAEVWAEASLYARGATIGAPPDAYNSLGQGWGLAAWRPDRLAASGYRPFRDLVRGMLRGCGGLRIDHIMGLFRLWWIPAGHGPREGAYVRYDYDAMVGILMLEAARAGALIVGEDLGTVQPWVRDYLAERGVLGTSVLWFENDRHGMPLAPEQYREYCMASVTTHDLAPTAGYLHGTHVAVRDRLGLLGQPVAAARAELEDDLDRWRAILADRGMLCACDAAAPAPPAQRPHPSEPVDATEAEILALHRYLVATPARVLCAALTDATGDRQMQNQPGTVNEYPNWRVRLASFEGRPVSLEDLRTSVRAARLAAVLSSA